MNFTISRSELYEALHKVVGVVPQKTTISILTCILMELKEKKLQLTGTDLEISVTHSLDVDSSDEGAVAVPAKLLVEIVRELPDVPVNIISETDDRIILKTEKGEYKIATQPREDFPNITVEESEHNFWIDCQHLADMTNKTIFAVSADELRPALTGINVELVESNLIFVATDGHRLAKVVYKDFQTQAAEQRVKMIVPTKALNLMMRNLEDAKQLNVQIGEDHVVFRLDNAIIYSKLISGTYPNYERVLPASNDILLRVDRELLISTLRRVSIFSSSLTNQVRLVLTPDEITIHSEDIEFGAEATESIPAVFAGEWMQIGYNSVYLIDILRHIDTEEVHFKLKDSGSAAIIHPSEQPEKVEITMLIMPIRISEEESRSD
ncbi:DNA polymerase III subunit beta [candidate division KSB1 bacterium]|nr:DNA polymerase III subunit beta [candidate division KSB1 bacterium]RQW02578.1 MAG: DNA polymerase III subunit beta [candidate division KSB1 bacterium]